MNVGSVSAGTVIAERYRLERPLGVGGSATVWAATDIVLERAVAVKLLRDAAADDQAERERLRREARTLARLAHPRIVTVWDFFETELPGAPEQPVLVTELVGGESLADRLEQGPLSWEQAVRICGQLADALRAAHEVGIVHRDVKPGNVVLLGDGVKLLDFGIARSPHDAPLTGNLTIGTPLCMAPEQIRGRGAVPESDIYALGCVLFWCLTGHPPYQGADVADILEAHLCDPPPPLDVPGLPPEIAEFCHACLEKNPSFRPDADRAVGALFSGEPRTVPIGAVKGDEGKIGSRTGRLGAGTLGLIKAGLTTGRLGAGRTSAGPPPKVGADTVRHRIERDRPPLVPVLAAVVLFAAVSVTAVILLIGTSGSGTDHPVAAPSPPARSSLPTAGEPSTSGPSTSIPAISLPPFTAKPVGDPLQYLNSVRQQITDLVAQGPQTMNPTTGGDLQNSIADIQNSVISARQNGGAAHLQEIRDKISEFEGRLAGLVNQGRVSSAAAGQLTGEMSQLSSAVTD